MGLSKALYQKLYKKIRSFNSWDEFAEVVDSLFSTTEKGDLFERSTQLYPETHSEFRIKLKNAWPLTDVPPEIAKKLNLTGADEGIDLIAETRDGAFWTVQCKYHSEEDKALNARNLSTFTNMSFVH